MSRYLITPRTLLTDTENAQFEATGEARTITKLHALALDLDDAEQPYVARQIELAAACTCGCGELQLPLIQKREQLDQAQRRLTVKAQQHVGLLAQFQRTANGCLEQLRVLICRFLAAGGSMEPLVQIAGYRREGPDGGGMKYAIADRFSESARRTAIRETYKPTRLGPRRTQDREFCPLGVMILVTSNGAISVGAPTCCDVRAFIETGELLDPHDVRPCPPECDDAAQFINGWDDGKISDLAEALGVLP